MDARRPGPSNVTNDAWALVAPSLMLLPDDAGQREHALREVFNGLRNVITTGAPWRWMPLALHWAAVWQQAQCWLAAGCFEALAEDLRTVLRVRSPPESGARAGYGDAKRKRGPRLHLAADTPGHPLTLHMTPASMDDRAESAKGVRQLRGRRFP